MSGSERGSNLPIEGRSANHFQLAFTRTEFLLDFGQEYGDPGEPLIHTRIIMTPSAARTLALMMQEIVQRYDRMLEPSAESQE